MDRWSFVAIGTLVTAAAALLGCGGTVPPAAQAASEPSEESSDPQPPSPPPPAAPPVAEKPPPLAPPPPSPPPPAPVKRQREAKRPAAVPRSKHPDDAPPPPLPGTPIATPPEFARLEDGKSRIWVEVSRTVDVAENRSPGRVVYRLRGAAVLQRSDQLPLPTGFFNTPVERVQILPDGSNVDLVILLREEVVPNYRVVVTPRGMVLQVDFPRGASFGREEPPPAAEPSRPRAQRAPKARTLRRQREPGEDPPPMDDN
jgi:hypothetical protein